VLRAFLVPIAVLLGTVVGIFLRPEFFDISSLVLTLGGAITVTCFSYSRTQLRDLMDGVRALFTAPSQSLQDHIDELARLTHLYRLEGLRGLENQERHLPDAFLRQGVVMLVDLQKTELIHARLERQRASVLSQHEISRQILLTLGKLLPSFGLIGTLTGMVLLLKNISGENAQSLPAALSLAVLTTLYGAVLANVVVSPLAARLHAVAVETEAKMRLTMEWVMMLLRGEGAAKIVNKWNGTVPPHETEIIRSLEWTPAGLLTQR
jgi:chemotaxis protein MotA